MKITDLSVAILLSKELKHHVELLRRLKLAPDKVTVEVYGPGLPSVPSERQFDVRTKVLVRELQDKISNIRMELIGLGVYPTQEESGEDEPTPYAPPEPIPVPAPPSFQVPEELPDDLDSL